MRERSTVHVHRRRATPMRSRRLGTALSAASPRPAGPRAAFPGLWMGEPESPRRAIFSGSAAMLVHGLALGVLVLYALDAKVVDNDFIPLQLFPEPQIEDAPKILAERASAFFDPVQALAQRILEAAEAEVVPEVSNETVEMESVDWKEAPLDIQRRQIESSRAMAVDEIAAARAVAMDLAGFDTSNLGDVEAPTSLDRIGVPRDVAVAAADHIRADGEAIGTVSALREGVVTGRDVIGVADGVPLPPEIETNVSAEYLRRAIREMQQTGELHQSSCFSRPIVQRYVALLKTRVYVRWTIPVGVSPDQSVTLRFSLDAAGSASAIEIVAADDRAMGASALDAFQSSSPFPPIPDDARCLVAQPFTAIFRNPGVAS